MDLSNIDFFPLQTRLMQTDPTTRGLCKGLNQIFGKLMESLPKSFGTLMTKLAPESLTDAMLSQIAYDQHVDWYDNEAELDARLSSVISSRDVYRQIGTPAAVEWAVQPYFNSAYVQEWNEYGGTPLHYKIFVQGTLTDAESAQLYRAIDKAARLGAVLDAVATIEVTATGMFSAGAMLRSRTTTIGG